MNTYLGVQSWRLSYLVNSRNEGRRKSFSKNVNLTKKIQLFFKTAKMSKRLARSSYSISREKSENKTLLKKSFNSSREKLEELRIVKKDRLIQFMRKIGKIKKNAIKSLN